MHKSFLIFVIILTLALSCFSQNKKLKLTADDKSAIVESILKSFFEDYPDEIDSNEIVLSSLNINSSFVPKHLRVKLFLLSPDEINIKANRERFVNYLIFSKFETKGSKVFVTLENLSVRSANSDVKPFFGHDFMWKVRKKSGKWVAECINTSAFTSISGE